jgi:FkbM family methyltransferase
MATPQELVPGSRYTIVRDNPHYPPLCVFDAADGISAGVISGADWEPRVCGVMARMYVPGTDVVDVGANLGLNSIGMHRRAPITGSVHLFEPQHDVFSALRYNARHLPAMLYNFGVADGVRMLCFEQVHGNVGGTPLQGAGGALGSPFAFPVSKQATRVLAAALDDMSFPNRVSVIKIDAEGAELNVLLGAKAFLATHRPAIVIEVWPQNRPEVFELLQQKLGYVMREHIQDTFGDDFLWVPAEPAAEQQA